METFNVIQEIKRHSLLIVLADNHKEIVIFIEVASIECDLNQFMFSVRILRVMSNEIHVLFFSSQGLRINAAIYIEELDTVVKTL